MSMLISHRWLNSLRLMQARQARKNIVWSDLLNDENMPILRGHFRLLVYTLGEPVNDSRVT
jgi:hypothetical protein